MNACEISTVEQAAEYFAYMSALFPGYKVAIKADARESDGDVSTAVIDPVRAVLNQLSKRVEIEVEL